MKVLLTIIIFIFSVYIYSQESETVNPIIDKSFEYTKVDTAVILFNGWKLRFINEMEKTEYYNWFQDDSVIVTGYLNNNLDTSVRKYYSKGKVINSIDFDTIYIDFYKAIDIAYSAGYNFDTTDLRFVFKQEVYGLYDDGWFVEDLETISDGNWTYYNGIIIRHNNGRIHPYKITEEHFPDINAPKITEAQFIGGIDSLNIFFISNSRYPICNESKNRVTASLYIDSQGRLTDIDMWEYAATKYKREALRMIKSMPKWIPAKQGTLNIESYKTLSINFK